MLQYSGDMRLLVLFALTAILAVPVAWADDWGDVAVVSRTLGVKADRLCLGEGTRHDIGCPDYAPYVSATSGFVGIGTTTPYDNLHVVSYSLRGIRLDNISSTYSRFVGANGALYIEAGVSNTVGSTADMKFTGFNGAALHMVIASNSTVGIGGISRPRTALDVSGTLRIANGGEACDATLAGAIRYASGSFDFCDGGGTWKSLASMAGGGTSDRIVSGTSAAIISPTGDLNVRGRLEMQDSVGMVALGASAGASTATRSLSTFAGFRAGQFSSGNQVTAIGYAAGMYNTGSYTTVVGSGAGKNSTSNAVTAVGFYAGVSNTFSNVTLLGYGVYAADKDNQVVLGNGSVVEVKTSGVVAAAGVSTTGNAYISGTIRLSGSPGDTCGPGAYGTVRVINNKMFMCRP